VLVLLFNSTVTDNDADHDRDMKGGTGGGISSQTGSYFGAIDSLIARNTLLDSPIYNDCTGNLSPQGVVVMSDVAGCKFSAAIGAVSLIHPDDPSQMDTMLKDNGGPTSTVALLNGSRAIDRALVCTDERGNPLTTDQRGAPRVAGAQCDVGAYEFDAIVP
jgi:hypothetical protein